MGKQNQERVIQEIENDVCTKNRALSDALRIMMARRKIYCKRKDEFEHIALLKQTSSLCDRLEKLKSLLVIEDEQKFEELDVGGLNDLNFDEKAFSEYIYSSLRAKSLSQHWQAKSMDANVQTLLFSRSKMSSGAFLMSDDRTSIKRTSQGHKYALVDTEPVKEGKHCWRVELNDDNKQWICFGVAHPTIPKTDNNYEQMYGCSGANQWYNNRNANVTNNKVYTTHLFSARFVDILLDLIDGTLKICEVGNLKEIIFSNMPRDREYVPAFNIHGNGIEIRVAKIPTTWCGKDKEFEWSL